MSPEAGIGATWSRDRRKVEEGPRAFWGSDLEGGHWAAVPLRLISGRIPNNWGLSSTSTAAPLAGCDRAADQGRVVRTPILCASQGCGCDPLAAGPFAGAGVIAPRFRMVDAALRAPSRTTLRETESGAHPQRGPSSALRRAPSCLWGCDVELPAGRRCSSDGIGVYSSEAAA
jgi:hypothetical protein